MLELFSHETGQGLKDRSLPVLGKQLHSSRIELMLKAILLLLHTAVRTVLELKRQTTVSTSAPTTNTPLSHSLPKLLEQNTELTVHTRARESMQTSISSWTISPVSWPRNSCVPCSKDGCALLNQFSRVACSSLAVSVSPDWEQQLTLSIFSFLSYLVSFKEIIHTEYQYSQFNGIPM